MKVIFVTREPFPNGMAATNRIICLAKAYQSVGVDCHVLIFSSCVAQKPSIRKGEVNGVNYYYLNETKASSSYLRRLSSLWARIILFRRLKKELSPGDFVYGYYHESNLFASLVVNWVHRLKAYYISELCELPFGTGVETNIKNKQRRMALSHIFPKYDGVLAISDNLFNLAKKHCRPEGVVIKIPILVDFPQYNIPDKSSESEYPYVFHAGTLSQQKDGFLGMLEAFGKAKEKLPENIKYVVSGQIKESSNPGEVKRILTKYKIENCVEFVGYLNRAQVRQYLSKASLVISNRPPSQQNYYGFSTKIGEYLASGTPLITTNFGEVVNWIKDRETAYIVEPNDVNELSNAIVEAFSDKKQAQRIGENARKLCQTAFHYGNYGAVMFKQLQDITNNN